MTAPTTQQDTRDLPDATDILIVGCGPCGLMLANELGRRGVRAVLVDAKETTAFNPQANATQARTMEHYRRHGFVDEIRALGMPADFPTDIAYYTRLAGWELARFKLPTSGDARALIKTMSGAWSAAELPHRVSQKYVEQALLRHARKYATNVIRFRTRLVSFEEKDDHVACLIETEGEAPRTVRARYLVGADGARSTVRRTLGYSLVGEAGVQREFMGGRMYAIYLKCRDFYKAMPHAPAWMNVTVNAEQRAFQTSVDGVQEFAFHFQMKPGRNEDLITERDAIEEVHKGWGKSLDMEVLSRTAWTAGYTLVAERMQQGRVFIGGDAAHLFTPAGGMGYNTAIEDAVNLGWKLAAIAQGYGGPALMESYERERRPVAVRNTGYARTFADSLGGFVATPLLEEVSAQGDAERARAGAYYNRHAREEFNIPGFTFGARYDASPIIVGDGTKPPPDGPNIYHPTATPGGRAPHLWLDDGRSLYDLFNFDWTVLRLSDDEASARGAAAMVAAAQAIGMDLRVVKPPHAQAREHYEADLALIRPDQIVAWRGGGDRFDARAVIAQASGRGAPAR